MLCQLYRNHSIMPSQSANNKHPSTLTCIYHRPLSCSDWCCNSMHLCCHLQAMNILDGIGRQVLEAVALSLGLGRYAFHNKILEDFPAQSPGGSTLETWR